MSLAVFDQVAGQFALGEECVTGYDNPFNVEVRQQRGGCFYFIGLLEFIASSYRNEACFFWA